MGGGERTAVIVGGSRGIGAAAAKRLAQIGYRIVLTYRQRHRHAAEVAAAIAADGGNAEIVQLDICVDDDLRRIADMLARRETAIDVLILSASGGLERDQPATYAEAINVDAQQRIIDLLLPLMPTGGHVVFLTSHEAHFSDRVPPYGPYARVATSKRLGETRLRERGAEMIARAVELHVVSADIVVGTATAKLLEMSNPGLLDARRDQIGKLPTVSDIADVLAALCAQPAIPGVSTRFIWDPGDKYRARECRMARAELYLCR